MWVQEIKNLQQHNNECPATERTFTSTSITRPGSSKAVQVCWCMSPDTMQRCPEMPGAAMRYRLLQAQLSSAAPSCCAMFQIQILFLLHKVLLILAQIWPTSVDNNLNKQCRVNEGVKLPVLLPQTGKLCHIYTGLTLSWSRRRDTSCQLTLPRCVYTFLSFCQ